VYAKNRASTSAWALGEKFSSETGLNNEDSPHFTGKERGILPLVKPNNFAKVIAIANGSRVAQWLFRSFPILILWPVNTVHSQSALASEGMGFLPQANQMRGLNSLTSKRSKNLRDQGDTLMR